MNLEDLPLMLTVDELADDVLRVDRKLAYRIVENEEIRVVRVGRLIRIPREAVAEYLGVADLEQDQAEVTPLRVVGESGASPPYEEGPSEESPSTSVTRKSNSFSGKDTTGPDDGRREPR